MKTHNAYLIKISRTVQLFYIGILIFVCALFALYWLLTHVIVRFQITPKNAVVTINNASLPLSAVGKASKIMEPGNYTIKVEADGFVPIVKNYQLGRAQLITINPTLKALSEPLTVAAGGSLLSKDPGFNTFAFLDNKALYRDRLGLDDQGVIQIKNKGRLTEEKLTGIQEIVWGPNRDLALFRKSDGIYLFDFKKYDFVNQVETLWGKDIGSIAWSPDNTTIAYSYAPAGGERTLIFSNLDNSVPTRVVNLAELNITNPILRWSPDSEWLLVIPRDTVNYDNNKVYLFNAYSRTMKVITETGNQLDAAFSPDGNQVIYSTYSKIDRSPIRSMVSIMNRDGSEKRSLDLRAELGKIIWRKDSSTVIVAGFDQSVQRESLFGYDLNTKSETQFLVNSIKNEHINSLAISDDNQFVLIETENGVKAIKIN